MAAPIYLRNYINGEWVPSASGRTADIINPATGELYAVCPMSSREEVDAAVAAAKAAFWDWRNHPLPDRVENMYTLRNKMMEAREELAAMITNEHGKTFKESLDELTRTFQYVEDACAATQTMMGSFTEDVAHNLDEYTIREPLGVFLILPPFNFPAMISCYFVWAVACGNTVVIKPSSLTPTTITRIVELAEESGFPPGVINVLNGSGSSIGDYLVTHKDIAGVSFVGSSEVGLHIYGQACATGKRAQVQGGAKNHVLVMEDAVMGETVKNVISSCFGHVGERCFAVSNILAVESVYDDFKAQFLDMAREIRVGNGMDPDTGLGPVVNKAALENILAAVDRALAEGATMLLDGRGVNVPGYPDGCFIGPTILEAEPEMECFQREIFGPVRFMKRVKDLQEGVYVINESPFGHTACIYTENGKYARMFTKMVNTGQVGINVGTPAPIAFYPVGGRKISFFGSTRGRASDAVDFYTDKKVVVSRWMRRLDFEVDRGPSRLPVNW